jgi:hypothetical protein
MFSAQTEKSPVSVTSGGNRVSVAGPPVQACVSAEATHANGRIRRCQLIVSVCGTLDTLVIVLFESV